MGSWLSSNRSCKCTALSAQELYNLQADLHSFCLILDLRPAAQFNQWHLDQAVAVSPITTLSLSLGCSLNDVCIQVSLPGATTEQALELAAARPYTHLVLCAPASCIKLCTVQGPCSRSNQEMFEGPATVQRPCLLISEQEMCSFRQLYPFHCFGHKHYTEGRCLPSVVHSEPSAPSGR